MTNRIQTQNGATHLVLLLALVVVAVAAFVGYRVMNNQDDLDSGQQAKVTQTLAPENITSASDLNQATQAVNQTPLDSELNPDQFDQDVQSLL